MKEPSPFPDVMENTNLLPGVMAMVGIIIHGFMINSTVFWWHDVKRMKE